LLGIFENVASVTFHERDYDRIMECVSREGEVVKVRNIFNCSKPNLLLGIISNVCAVSFNKSNTV